jgi:ADP-ribosylglycohydrolase
MQERAYGAILGGAIGEAFGLQVEGADPISIRDQYPYGLGFPYERSAEIVKPYAPNDWSDATDFTVLIMRVLGSYFTSRVDRPELEFARVISHWQKYGFEELGDPSGVGAESVVARATQLQNFLTHPAAAARAVKGPKAENGALLRTAPCAFTAAPADWALVMCETTHADERCAASAVMFSLMLNHLARLPDGTAVRAADIVDPIQAGREMIPEPQRQRDYMQRLTHSKEVSELRLGDQENRSYTLKTLACAMWAFRQLARTPPENWDAEFFQDVITEIASQGGDASANCAVVGMVLGAAMGLKKLPAEWITATPDHEWLMGEIDAFLLATTPTWQKDD